MNRYSEFANRRIIIWNREHTEQGLTTGTTQLCRLEGCGGTRIGVRWPDNHITWPCENGIHFVSETEGQIQ